MTEGWEPGLVFAVSVGRADLLRGGGREVPSAYLKRPVDGPVKLTHTGFDGDEQVYETHGGPDKAVLVYSKVNYPYWVELHGLDLPSQAAFGENLTIAGLPEVEVHLGDIFEVGTCVVQVTSPRAPCFKHAVRYSVPRMALEMQRSGRTGYLLRVLQEGYVQAGDSLHLQRRLGHGITVADANAILNVNRRDLEGARQLLATPDLPLLLRHDLLERLRANGFAEDAERLYGDSAATIST